MSWVFDILALLDVQIDQSIKIRTLPMSQESGHFPWQPEHILLTIPHVRYLSGHSSKLGFAIPKVGMFSHLGSIHNIQIAPFRRVSQDEWLRVQIQAEIAHRDVSNKSLNQSANRVALSFAGIGWGMQWRRLVSVSGGERTVTSYVLRRLVELGFYALSASKAIFRARTYNCNLFSPVMMTT